MIQNAGDTRVRAGVGVIFSRLEVLAKAEYLNRKEKIWNNVYPVNYII